MQGNKILSDKYDDYNREQSIPFSDARSSLQGVLTGVAESAIQNRGNMTAQLFEKPIFKLIRNDLSEKMITLSERQKKCRHKQLLIDEESASVECADCGELLNPMAMLARFTKEQSVWQYRLEELKKFEAEIDKKKRCKCEHCEKMTRIVR